MTEVISIASSAASSAGSAFARSGSASQAKAAPIGRIAAQRAQLCSPLVPHPKTAARRESGRARCRAAAAVAAAVLRIVISIESRIASGVPFSASKRRTTLGSAGSPDSGRIPREVAVDLRCEIGAGERQRRGLHMKPAFGGRIAERRRGRRLACRLLPPGESPLDGLEALSRGPASRTSAPAQSRRTPTERSRAGRRSLRLPGRGSVPDPAISSL